MEVENSSRPSGSGPVPTLRNIASTANLGCKPVLETNVLHARHAIYNPKHSAVILRLKKRKARSLIFDCGKQVCTGGKTENESRLAGRKSVKIIRNLGFPAKLKDFKIVNMVASCDLGFPLKLEKFLCSRLGAFPNYEPEIFPGLIYIYHMKKPKIVMYKFASGKIPISGARKREEIYTALDNIHPVL